MAAHFRAMSSVGGAGATITVTYSSDFYGVDITATNGTETHTITATSSGEVVFNISEAGTWTISATVDGQTYSETVNVTLEYTSELIAIPDGSTVTPVNSIPIWLKCAMIRDKSYTTLSQVLNDTETFIALCADSNACDYMARSTNWASGVAADSTAMLIVGKYNYCANALLSDSTWASAICNSTYASSVVSALVPIMTSNTTPSGECFGSSSYSSGYPYYYAFDNSSSTSWASSVADAVGSYLGYDFGTDVHIGAIKIIGKGTNNNPTNITVQGYDTEWHDISTFDVNTSTIIYGISNTSTYTKYRVKVNSFDGTQGTNNVGVQTLQFYGRTDNANYIPLVPTMTSNTTPSGECTASTVYGTGYEAYRAFDNYTNGWCPNNSDSYGNAHITYEFDTAVVVNRWKVRNVDNNSSTSHNKVYKLRGSNTGNSGDWTDLSTTSALANVNQDYYLDFVNSTAYKYFDFVIVSGDSGKLTADSGQKFQLYKKATNPIIHSAVEDNIFYMDDGSPVALCGIPVGDTIDVDLESFKGQTLTLVSTVAKDPTNLSNDFSMNVRITPNITEIYLMPIKSLYWWGYMSDNCEELSTANGWSGIFIAPVTSNTNYIFCPQTTVNGASCGIGSKTTVSGDIKAIYQGITARSGRYGYLSCDNSKVISTYNAYVATTTLQVVSASGQTNKYVSMSAYGQTNDSNGKMSGNIYALWLE